MKIQIYYWTTTFPEVKYKHCQEFKYSKRRRNQIIDDLLSYGYSLMIRQYTDLIIYIDKGKFKQS